ncbi:ubiquitin carboxyl-terminal hydrolase 1 [Diaphorina citri]|uniref:Ubiquitin carboxyl-terminal hydrolase 1 n=1 Tax=Diaphorina citri TaxID=121845 RepID=A0A3Q0IVL9_DIACI|nr:ubiquitin carboxyl-terminal hydrolase 1 [Diaphorina citri]
MTVLSEDSDEASRLNHPRKKARLSRHVVSNALDYKVVTSTPVYLNNYMETDFYSGGVNGCNLRGPDSPSPCSGVDDLYSSPPPPSASSDLSPPVATLCNLGNTCFLNSVLYTLRFAPSFLHNLHHLVNDINVVTSHTKMMKGKSSSLSRLGNTVSNKMWSREPSFIPEAKMQCTSQLHEVYEDLRRNEIPSNSVPDPVHPTKFMQSLRAVNSMFEGNQQHDAHELYIFLLDNLRETSKDVFKFASQYNLTASPSSPHYLSLSSPSSPSPSSSSANSLLTTGSSSSTKKIQDKLKKSIKRFRANNSQDSKKNLMTASTNSLNNERHYDKNGDVLGGASGALADSGACFLDMNNITEDFQGVSIIRTICTECETVRERKEVFCDICVPINADECRGMGYANERDHVNDLYRNAIVTEEMLIEANKYWCEACLRYNEAKRCYRFETLPRLLTLHLKRFSSGFNSGVSKVSNFMPTPFKLKCFCELCLSPSSSELHSYDLYAVIMHLGSTIASGHYVSYVRARDSSCDYVQCPKDKRRGGGNGGSMSGSAGGSLLSSEMEKSKSGILKFLRPNKSIEPPPESFAKLSAAQNSALAATRVCRTSLECCGIRIRDKTAAGRPAEESTWLECDDENVRTLSQAQFEDMLAKSSSAQGTPYLLFYTRV